MFQICENGESIVDGLAVRSCLATECLTKFGTEGSTPRAQSVNVFYPFFVLGPQFVHVFCFSSCVYLFQFVLCSSFTIVGADPFADRAELPLEGTRNSPRSQLLDARILWESPFQNAELGIYVLFTEVSVHVPSFSILRSSQL